MSATKATQHTPPNLVIVESPAKAKTIEKFLGKDFRVLSSQGHIRDLSKKALGIDVANHFTPTYIETKDKAAIIKELQKAAQEAEVVWLASDEDREGEAIAWHLYEVLNLKDKTTKRIVFHEITQEAIKNAIAHPRDIDLNLVDAQQARRVLDRIVGFELSPLLWKRIMPSLSAGRVQSVTLRIVVDREREIKAFVPTSSYAVLGQFRSLTPEAYTLEAHMGGEALAQEKAKAFLEQNSTETFVVSGLDQKPGKRSPAPPFTTSTLQQEAARKLGYAVSTTMRVAQKLYEAGHITYMRTDSLNLSSLALNTAREVIHATWGEAYHQRRSFQTKSKGAQEAHEAIRPTYLQNKHIEGSIQEQKLYDLIRKRTLASQMADVALERTLVTLEGEHTQARFVAEGEVIRFAGFLMAYNYQSHDSEDDGAENTKPQEKTLPPMQKGDRLIPTQLVAKEHYSLPPSRYTEASLVRRLEELGIGRPSTYAPTIQVIQTRDYVERGTSSGEERLCKDYVVTPQQTTPQEVIRKEKTGATKGKLLPTDIGMVVTDYLTEHFPTVMDYNFTAKLEENFDQIAEGKKVWTQEMQHFYDLFHPMIEQAANESVGKDRGERFLGVDPKSGKPIIARIGRFGPLLQMGEKDNKSEKPRFVSLKGEFSIHTITLEEALALFSLPRTLGAYEELEVKIGEGRFGPYVLHKGVFTSIPKTMDPFAITLEQAIALIEEKRTQANSSEKLKLFDQDPELMVVNGRFGPYIKYGKESYNLPKELKERAGELTYEECLHLVQNNKPSRKRRSSSSMAASTKAKKKA